MSAENPKYWGLEDDERLTCNTIEERLEKLYEECDGHMPETIDVFGYDPRIVDTKNLPDWFLENFLEYLDDEYDGEDGTDPTETMRAAAIEFVNKIVAEYHVWQCEIVCKKTIKVADYITPEATDDEA